MATTRASILAAAAICGLCLGSETKVQMKDLPPAVQKTVAEQSKGAIVRGLAKEVEDGKTFYEVELKVKGRTRDVLIDPTGAVVSVEQEVALDSMPGAARAASEKGAGKGRIVLVESVTAGGKV
ncbi:MAG: hypothetical protein HY013_00925, partial [Candidatus Solibacter usitatus]|nr:hypothetical protein [Candidatus Solibacter usitatus]